jgi:Kef-type K+ transport system membrane component KefB/nucleotide-binding universal stress UspA family protein
VGRRVSTVFLGVLFACVATAAWAAQAKSSSGGTGLGGSGEAILVAQILLLLLVGRGLGEVMQRFGQPAVIGQLLAGLILGPSLFGWVWPHAHDLIFPKTPEQKSLISGIANMGVMMLLLLTGMETDLKLVRKVGAPAIAITATGVAVPFLCGFALGQLIPESILPAAQHRLVASLFIGTALSISSIKIVAMVVREMHFTRRNLGQIIVASAIMEDTTGWIIVSITLGIAGAGGFALGSLAKTVIGTAVFLVLSYTVGRKLVFWLIRWVNDTFVSEYAVITAILAVMCLLALITQGIGVNTVLGSFVAGVLIGESPILSKHIQDQLRGFITAFMMPIFFGLSGLSADLTILKDPHLALLTFGLVVIASVGKFGGAFTGGVISGLSMRESMALGCAMNARGSTEVIVASIGLTMGALTQNLYTMIVTMAVITTMAMPPMLRWALRRLPMSKEEKDRLEKEELDAKGFVSKFERLLIAADESANGKLASRLAGVIAGRRGIPVTVQPIKRARKSASVEAAALATVATEGAKEGHQASGDGNGEPRAERVEVSARVEETAKDAIAKEAPKGYDILFLGVEKMVTQGGFAPEVDRTTADFRGPIALVFGGEHLTKESGFNVLVPVTGTDTARRGAEIAFAITAPQEGKITAVHVADRRAAAPRSRARRRKTERALVDDLKALARRYGHDDIMSDAHTDAEPHEAILAEAKASNADLIVLGTNRRIGDHLAVGQTAARVMEDWKGAMLIVVI